MKLIDCIGPDQKGRPKKLLVYSDHPVVARITYEVSRAVSLLRKLL